MNRVMRIVGSSLFLFFVGTTNAQENNYVVLHVDGKITYSKKDQQLKIGDVIKDNPEFNFSSLWDKAKLWKDQSGYWYLYPRDPDSDNRSLFGFSFLSNLQSQTEYTATRGDDEELSYLFFRNESLLFKKEIRVFFKPKDQKSHYFFEFSHKGDTLQRKLTLDDHKNLYITDDVLQLSEDNINIVDIQYAKIGFHDANSGKDTILKGIIYAFADMAVIEKQLGLLKELLVQNGQEAKSIRTALQSYLESTYGTDITVDNFQIVPQ